MIHVPQSVEFAPATGVLTANFGPYKNLSPGDVLLVEMKVPPPGTRILIRPRDAEAPTKPIVAGLARIIEGYVDDPIQAQQIAERVVEIYNAGGA